MRKKAEHVVTAGRVKNVGWVERNEPHHLLPFAFLVPSSSYRWLLLATLLAAGCGDGNDPFNQPKRQVNPDAFGVNSDQTPPPPPPSASTVSSTSSTSNLPPPPPPPPAATATTPPSAAGAQAGPPAAEVPSANAVKAEPGVGKKGRGYGAGMVTTPIAAYFSVRERLAFDQVAHAMDLYKATNEHGPKSHEEFMEKIIKENGIKLPQLPAGERYLYDPKTEQLMVERPDPNQ